MKIQTTLALALLATTVNAYSPFMARALDNTADSSGEEAIQSQTATDLDANKDATEIDNFGPVHGGGGFHPAPPRPVFHPAPPAPHPFPGPHPFPPGHVYNPYPVHGGAYPWPHWGHPIFARPVFPFEWNRLRLVTCTAENSSGYQFPLTEDGFFGIAYQARMEQIEDAAIDRCYAETNGDQSCVLLGCTAGY